jgi:hypothetical protein
VQIFNSGLFWFVEGILFVVVVLAVRSWAGDRGVRMQVWKWALLLAWLGFAGFTVAFVGTSFGEGEPVAGARGGLFFGLVAIIAGVGLWRFLLAGAGSGGEDAASEA